MDFTFLNEDQIWGDRALDVMKRYGTKVAPTDLTVILGGAMTGKYDRTSEGDLTCMSWSVSPIEVSNVTCVFFEGGSVNGHVRSRAISARPVLPPSEASKISPSKARTIDGIRIAEYGEYPQTVADDVTCERLERLHSSGSLRPTGKNYTFASFVLPIPDPDFESISYIDFDAPFKATSYQEYEMDGKRYIRVLGRPHNCESKLSSKWERVKERKPYWVQVQPIEWLMDPSGTMVAKKCLFAGIQYDRKKKDDGDFSKTFMKHYLDTYFAKEMEPTERVAARTVSRDYEEEGTRTIQSTIRRFGKSR